MSEKQQGLWTRIDNSLEKKIPEIWKIIKWIIMGGLASIVELGAHYLMQFVIFANIYNDPIPYGGLQSFLSIFGLERGLGALYTFLISITIGYTIAYILNRKVTFKSATNLALSTFLYALMVIFTILAGAWIGTQLTNLLYVNNLSQWDFLVKIVQMMIPGLWTYPLMRFVIIRPDKNAPAEDSEESTDAPAEETVEAE